MSKLTISGKRIIFQKRDEIVYVEPYGSDCIRVRSTRNGTISDEGWTLLPPQTDKAEAVVNDDDSCTLTNGILTPSGRKKWSQTTVNSILRKDSIFLRTYFYPSELSVQTTDKTPVYLDFLLSCTA